MLASIKSTGFKIKNKVQRNVTKYHAKAYRFMLRHKRKLIAIGSLIGIIIIIITLILVSLRGVDVTNQAVVINWTENKIFGGTYSNHFRLTGVNAELFKVPKRKFLIYFQQGEPEHKEYWSNPIMARSQEGTKIKVQAKVSCLISFANQEQYDLRLFLQEYGLQWKKYAIGYIILYLRKSKNAIIQKIGLIKFYELSNQAIISSINAYFTSLKSNISGYPFTFKLLGLRVQYPDGSFSSDNTLGVQLLAEKSKQTQLSENYNNLVSRSNISELIAKGSKIGQLEAEVKLKQMQAFRMDPNWISGVTLLNQTFIDDPKLTRQFIWLYFQKVYNSTYNNYSIF